MLEPLKEESLAALVPDGGDGGIPSLGIARRTLLENRDLAWGLSNLFQPWEAFQSKLLYNEHEGAWQKRGKWKIGFRQHPFREVFVRPGGPVPCGRVDIWDLHKVLISFVILDRVANWRVMLEWLWHYGETLHNDPSPILIEPLDPEKMSALTREEELDVFHPENGRFNFFLRSAKRLLARGNLGEGVCNLLSAFNLFEERFHRDGSSISDRCTGWSNWYIDFQTPYFRKLRIEPDNPGSVRICAYGNPIASFGILGDGSDWQGLIIRVWKFGNQQAVVTSLPIINPHRLKALMCEQAETADDDIMSRMLLRTAKRQLLEGANRAEGIRSLLIAFKIFLPYVRYDDPSDSNEESTAPREESGCQRPWKIICPDSPFLNLQIKPSFQKGVVDIYTSGKLVRSFQVCESVQDLKTMLEWLWDYGNKRNFRKECRPFRPSTKLPAHSKNKKRVAEKPLLQQVLSQAGIKAQRDETPQRKARRSVPPKEFDMKSSFDLGNPIKRRALRATDSNKQKKPSPLAKCIDDN